jgi:hypothetical protein
MNGANLPVTRDQMASLNEPERAVTSLPVVVADGPMGIVIQNGRGAPRGTAIWAYMWVADEEELPHWHDVVPRERAA